MPRSNRTEDWYRQWREDAVPVTELQGTLAFELEPRADPPARPPELALVIDNTKPTASRREIDVWARRVVQAAVEVVGGDRPANQLLRWTSVEVYEQLAHRAALVAQAGHHRPGQRLVQQVRPMVAGARLCEVSDGVIEAAVHVRYGERSRAVAARFEWTDRRWVCTVLEFA